MSRYLIKFKKLGLIRYTSHLDMIRLFHRAFKRTEIYLEYSHGFNPHPKMSFAQPLSLGYISVGEYLEFETTETYDENDIMERLNGTMPSGIEIIGCWLLNQSKKTIASSVEWGTYEILCKDSFDVQITSLVDKFLNQEQILILKRQKKNAQMKEIDIKPLISVFKEIKEDEDSVNFYAMIRAGSASNLNPELLIKAFYKFANKTYRSEMITIKRLDLYKSEFDSLEPKTTLDK